MSDALFSRRQKQVVLSATAPSSESLDLDCVIVDILSRLPPKSLLRFRCVCKAWRALISDPYFIRNHLSRINTKISTSYCLLIKDLIFRSAEYEAILKCLSHDGPLPSRRLHFPVLDPLIDFSNTLIVGSCNGLICLILDIGAEESFTFMLWNPCTGESQVLPLPPLHSSQQCFFGFGFDSITDDYKVILGSYRSGHEFVVVFTIKSGSWRNLQRLDSYFKVSWVGCLVNEALHWVLKDVEDGRSIASKMVSFDLAEEKFHEIPFPFPPNPVDMRELVAGVGILNNCLTLYFQTMCFIPGCKFKMWVMKDYGVKESWTEVINFYFLDDEDIYMTCISENGEVLMRLAGDGSLALYNPKENTFRIVMDHGGYWDETATHIA